MIAPQNRLLFWTGAVMVPFAAIGSVFPSSSTASIVIIALLLALVIVDGAMSYRGLRGINVKLPEVVRLSKDREGYVEIIFTNNDSKSRHLRVGLAFPPEIFLPNEEMAVALPPESRNSRLRLPCRPLKRGRYYINKCYLEGNSTLGFWAMRACVSADSEIRVYPDLLTEQKNLSALFLNRGNSGIHSQRQVGQGRDFEKLREYIHGDSFDSIHWKATAKRGRPITKVFQVERTQEVYIIIDSSRLSARNINIATGSEHNNTGRSETVIDRFITSALVMGIAAERQGDQFGILNFSDRINSFIRAKNGRAHYNICRDMLYTLESQTVSPDFDELFSFISRKMRRRALLIFLTGLDDPLLAETFVKNMDLIRRKHLVIVNMLKPARVQPLFSQADVQSLDNIYENLGGHIIRNDLLELEKALKRRGVHFSLLNNEKMCAQLVSQYMSVKQRQVL